MANVIFNSFKKEIQDGSIDLDTDTIKVMLVTASYTPNQDTHTRRSDVTNEVTGSGYTSGGAALAGKAVTQDNTDNEGVFDATDLTWATATLTARAAVIYRDSGAAATDELIVYVDFGADKTSTGDDFKIIWDAEGIINLN